MLELNTDLINSMDADQMRTALHSIHAEQVINKQKADEQSRLKQEAEEAENARLDAYFRNKFSNQTI